MREWQTGFSASAVGGHLQTMLTIASEKIPSHERVWPSHRRRGRGIPGVDRTILVRPGRPFGRIAWILSVPLHDTNWIPNLHPDRSQPGS